MKKNIFIVFLIIICCCFCSCKNNTTEKQIFYPYQKITLIESTTKTYNPQWDETIKAQLIEQYHLSESNITKLMNNSTFQRCSIEYATYHEYENKKFPYCFKTEVIIWKSESYYAICEIYNKKIEAPNENIKIVLEGPKEPWIEDFKTLNVLPINQSSEITMGSRISFLDNSVKTGPFTIVNTFYISCL